MVSDGVIQDESKITPDYQFSRIIFEYFYRDINDVSSATLDTPCISPFILCEATQAEIIFTYKSSFTCTYLFRVWFHFIHNMASFWLNFKAFDIRDKPPVLYKIWAPERMGKQYFLQSLSKKPKIVQLIINKIKRKCWKCKIFALAKHQFFIFHEQLQIWSQLCTVFL